MSDKDNISMEAAAEWIQSLEYKWRLEILSKRALRTRDGLPVVDKNGVPREIPTRIRRYVEGIPWPFVKPAIDHLIATAPYSGLIANGVDFGDAQYRPTLTVWQRDSGHVTHPPTQRNPDATYTLIQDLIEVKENDTYAVGTQTSCSEEVETEYVWDSPDIEQLPGCCDATDGCQGVTYAIAAVHRNEDGTFDYQIVKRTAITQHQGPFIVHDDEFRTVSHELWDNVYGTLDDPQQRSCDGTMGPIDLDVGVDPTGTVTRIENLSENADCTLKFVVVKEVSKPVEKFKEGSRHTQFESDHDRTDYSQKQRLGEAPDAANGLITKHDTQLQPDGTYQNTVDTVQERPVTDSEVSVRVGRRGKRVTRTDVNQPAPASTAAVEVGGMVEVKKTPGRLFNNTVSTFDRTERVIAGDKCAEDLFRHTDADTVGGADMPGPDDHVVGGIDGRIVSRDVDMDDDGAISQTLTVVQERSVPASEESWDVTLRGVRHTVKDTQQPLDAAALPLEFSRENIGKRVSNERTPGGLVNVTRTALAKTDPLDVGVDCARTVFEETDSTTKSDPTADVTPVVHQTAGNGHTRQRSVRLAEDGSAVVEERLVTEIEQTSGKEYRRTPRGTIEKTTVRNTPRQAHMPSGIGSESHQMTPGGRYNLEIVNATPSATPDSSRCQQTVFEHAHDDVTFGSVVTAEDAPVAGGGHHYAVTEDMDELGVVKKVLRDTQELPYVKSSANLDTNYFQTSSQVVDVNQASDDVTELPVLAGDSHDELVVAHKMTTNPGGSVTLVNNTVTPVARTWEEVVDTDYMFGTIFYFRNLTEQELDARRQEAVDYFNDISARYNGTRGTRTGAPTSMTFNPSVTRNELGLFDGQYSALLHWAPESGGKDEAAEAEDDYVVLAEWQYWDVSVSTTPQTQRTSKKVDGGSKVQVTRELVGFQRVVTSRYIHQWIGRGWVAFANEKINSKNLLVGSTFSVTPSTGVFHATIVERVKTEWFFLEKSSLDEGRYGYGNTFDAGDVP